MGIQIETKKKEELTRKELGEISRLHFRDGWMWYKFKQNLKYKRLILAKSEGVVVGWAMLYSPFLLRAGCGKVCLHVYVKGKWRKKGIGRRLVKKAIAVSKRKPVVFKHDRGSKIFYNKFGKSLATE